MRANRVFCDICKKEVNFERDNSFGMLVLTKKEIKLNKLDRKNTSIDHSIVNTNIDICSECLNEIEKHINKIYIKNQNVKKDIDKKIN